MIAKRHRIRCIFMLMVAFVHFSFPDNYCIAELQLISLITFRHYVPSKIQSAGMESTRAQMKKCCKLNPFVFLPMDKAEFPLDRIRNCQIRKFLMTLNWSKCADVSEILAHFRLLSISLCTVRRLCGYWFMCSQLKWDFGSIPFAHSITIYDSDTITFRSTKPAQHFD